MHHVISLQVDWLNHFLGGEDGLLSKAVLWAGIQAVPSRAGPMEAVLRSKCFLLLVVTLKRRAVRYVLHCSYKFEFDFEFELDFVVCLLLSASSTPVAINFHVTSYAFWRTLHCRPAVPSKRHPEHCVMTNGMCHRWLNELPREVKEAAGPGCACCLFWPPADAAWRHTARGSGGLWQRVKKLPFVHYVDLAAKVSIFIHSYDG